MKSIMLICLFIILVCNLLTHRYLTQRIDILQEWIEFLYGIDFDKMSESVREWQSEQKEEPQTITMVKDHGRKQALEMIYLYHKLKTEQTESEDE